jgi:hypothetical protein
MERESAKLLIETFEFLTQRVRQLEGERYIFIANNNPENLVQMNMTQTLEGIEDMAKIKAKFEAYEDCIKFLIKKLKEIDENFDSDFNINTELN